MTDKNKRWLTHEELLNSPVQVSLINEPIDFEVDFVVEETATDRARRRWRMDEKEPEK
jgi:hypothetical protein